MEKDLNDAPANYDNDEAHSWAVGYNKGYAESKQQIEDMKKENNELREKLRIVTEIISKYSSKEAV